MPKDMMMRKVYTGKNVKSVLFSCRVRTQFFCHVNGLLVSVHNEWKLQWAQDLSGKIK